MRITDKTINEKIICGEKVKLTDGVEEIVLTKDNYFEILSFARYRAADWEMVPC